MKLSDICKIFSTFSDTCTKLQIYAIIQIKLYSLNPGSKPGACVVKLFHEAYRLRPGTLRVRSINCQQQDNVDCIVFSIANIWAFFKGLDPSQIVFDCTEHRSELFKSFKRRKFFFLIPTANIGGKKTFLNFLSKSWTLWNHK